MTNRPEISGAVADKASAGYVEKLEQAVEGCLKAMARINEAHAPFAIGHEMQVAELAAAIGNEMELPNEVIRGIRAAGSIHDIGYVTVPAEILNKLGKLTPYELLSVRNHVQAGFEIVRDIEFPWPVAKIILQHHERMDGSGYPHAITGDGIILEARIIAVADVVDAIASRRPYRPALGIQSACDEIAQGSGTIYDPDVVKACLKLLKEKAYASVYASSGISPDQHSTGTNT